MRKCPSCGCPNPDNRAACYSCSAELVASTPTPASGGGTATAAGNRETLDEETRRRIYEEEKARVEARQQVEQAQRQASADKATKDAAKGCLGCLGFLVLLVILFSVFGGGSDTGNNGQAADTVEITTDPGPITDRGQKIAVYSMAHQFVEESLKCPSTAKFPWSADDHTVESLGGGRYSVTSWVDAENSFGAHIRNHYYILMSKSGDIWTVEALNMQPQ